MAVSPLQAEEIGKYPVGASGLTMQLSATRPGNAKDVAAVKPLIGRQLSSLLVSFVDGEGRAAAQVSGLTFLAEMPQYSQGMVVKPKIHAVMPGLYRIDGVKLHMPGLWKLTFYVVVGGTQHTVVISLKV